MSTQATAPSATQAAPPPLNNTLTPASLLHYVPACLQVRNTYYERPYYKVDIDVHGVNLGLIDAAADSFGHRIGIGTDWFAPAAAREVANAILAIADAHDASQAQATAAAEGGAA